MELRRARWVFALFVGLAAGACEDDVAPAGGAPADATSDPVSGDQAPIDAVAETGPEDTTTPGEDAPADSEAEDVRLSDSSGADITADAPDDVPGDSAEDAPGPDTTEEIAEEQDSGDAADVPPSDSPVDLGDPVDLVQAICGARAGDTCREDQYCDFPDNQCGAADMPGTCEQRPEICPRFFQPVCGCDGTVHSNECEAYFNGADLNAFGGCPPPEGWMPCGARFCVISLNYCEHFIPGVAGAPVADTCRNLPEECGDEPDCDCLSEVGCGDNCVETEDGGLQVTCIAP